MKIPIDTENMPELVESDTMVVALAMFLSGTEDLHDAIKANDNEAVLKAVTVLYEARNLVAPLLVEGGDDTVTKEGE